MIIFLNKSLTSPGLLHSRLLTNFCPRGVTGFDLVFYPLQSLFSWGYRTYKKWSLKTGQDSSRKPLPSATQRLL